MEELTTFETALMVGVGATMITLVLIGLPTLVLLVMFSLAKKGLFWLLPGEGQAFAIMTSNTFSGFVMKYKGYHINNPHKEYFNKDFPVWERIEDSKNPLYKPEKPTFLQRYFGVEWIGLPPNRVYHYMFDWIETAQDEIGKTVPRHRRENTNFIYVSSFPYLLYLHTAETSENLQVNGYIVVEFECINPYKALFATTDWFTAVCSAALATTRSYVGNYSFEELRKQAKDGGVEQRDRTDATSLLYTVCALNKRLPPDLATGTEKEYGIRIKSARLLNIDLVGDREGKVQAAQTAKYVAVQNKAAAVTAAEGDRDSRVIRAEGYRQEAQKMSENQDDSRLIRYLETMKTEGKGDKVVVWPTLEQIIKKIGGGEK